MIRQDWMIIVSGEALVDDMSNEQRAKVERTGAGFNSEQLCTLQRDQAARGILGAEIVQSNYGFSVRYDSGLQNFGLLASSRARELDGTLEDAERWAKRWVEADPQRRYAWRRKTEQERAQ